ncbi:hypothetical protein SUNI508_10735 [Seiridium unicorne]|uniref:Transmembrane protein n=1 Tax=Seiridium unicorne TaxID=138068 RepID=A0ABR2UK03_9PEZI
MRKRENNARFTRSGGPNLVTEPFLPTLLPDHPSSQWIKDLRKDIQRDWVGMLHQFITVLLPSSPKTIKHEHISKRKFDQSPLHQPGSDSSHHKMPFAVVSEVTRDSIVIISLLWFCCRVLYGDQTYHWLYWIPFPVFLEVATFLLVLGFVLLAPRN